MIASSALFKLFVAVPLLASSLAAGVPASSLERRSDGTQFVLGGDANVYSSDDASSLQREPDFVEAMLLEAQRKGMDVGRWGVEKEAMQKITESMQDSATSFVEHASVDLNDEAQRLELLAEAALDETLVWIQPITKAEEEEKVVVPAPLVADEPVHSMQPGSGWVWNVCGSHQEAIVLKEVNVDPDPPVPGRNLTVYAKGTVNADIEEGAYADVVVKLGFIRLLSRRFDICQLAKENNAELQCPLKPGEYELTHTVELPREIPPARFNVHVSGKTQADVDLMCMDVNIDFSH